MRVGYVVLYVNDVDACLDFWVNSIGMELHEATQVSEHSIYRVGFNHQQFSFELVPLKLMQENPDGLDLATPSICFYVDDIQMGLQRLRASGVSTTEISKHMGRSNFAFSDNEDRWFAVLERKLRSSTSD